MLGRPSLQASCLTLILVLTACEARGGKSGKSQTDRSGADLSSLGTPGTNSGGAAAPRASGSTTSVSSGVTIGLRRNGWNTSKIEWQAFATGLQQAKSENKPVCLVFYTEWCPHCRAYSHVFEDERVVERARDFVMIRVDADADPALSAKYMPDGKYIPRTYFLTSDGTLDGSLHAPAKHYQFFYDEDDPTSLLLGMQAAAQKLAPR